MPSTMINGPTVLASTIIDAKPVDYLIVFLSGRSLPAWVTGLAFISANLGAVEIMGMSANGAQFGIPTVHYFWIGAIPAMLFLGVVMMPFYYGSKVRSVPEFMLRRFGPGAHLVNAISFAVAQLLIAGINLFLLASIVHALLGWSLWVALVVAAAIVLSYITLGGLSAAIYNEVLQFFVIVASLLPLTLIGLHRVGGWSGMEEKIADFALETPRLNTSPLPEYGYDRLDYGMTIGIERTPGGRLWACWVAGGDSPKAFFVLATSDDV